MAKTRPKGWREREIKRRTLWVRFLLAPGLQWPQWSKTYANAHYGPMEHANGCQRVMLGREVDNREQAVLVILWETREALEGFKGSAACRDLVTDLGIEPTIVNPFFSLEHSSSFHGYGPELDGRITIFTFYCHSRDFKTRGGTVLDRLQAKFADFIPKNCGDLGHSWHTRTRRRTAAWPAEGESEKTFHMIYRWRVPYNDIQDREEASFRDPESMAAWVELIRPVAGVIDWEAQRWDFVCRGYDRSRS